MHLLSFVLSFSLILALFNQICTGSNGKFGGKILVFNCYFNLTLLFYLKKHFV